MTKLITFMAFIACFALKGAVGIKDVAVMSWTQDPDAVNYFNRVKGVSQLSHGQQMAVNTFCVSAKRNGYWTNLVDTGCFGGTTLTGAQEKIKFPPYVQHNLTNLSMVASNYIETTGVKGASGKQFATGMNWTNFGKTSIGLSFYLNEDSLNSPATTYFIGNGAAAPFALIRASGNTLVYNLGPTTVTPYSTTTFASGLYRAGRSDTNNMLYSVGGVPINTNTTFTFTNNDALLTVCAGNNLNPSTNALAFYAFDDGLMSQNQSMLMGRDVENLVRGMLRKAPLAYPMRLVPIVGQSLAIGFGAAPLSTGVSNNNNRRFTSTVVAPYCGSIPKLTEVQTETIASAFAHNVSAVTGNASNDSVMASWGINGALYSIISKGTSNYAYSINGVSNTVWLSQAQNSGMIVPAILSVHGETDNTSSTYQSDITQWQVDYETDIKALTGQTGALPMFHSQISSWTCSALNTTTNKTSYAMLAAYKLNPTTNVLVCPKYFLPYISDGLHLTNSGYRWLGEYYAKAYYRTVIQGQTWQPLYPTNISRTLTTIDLTFPTTNDLAFDTTLVAAAANMGFEYFDDGAVPPVILSVAFTGSSPTNKVRIMLTSNPVGNARIRYAYTGTNTVVSRGGNATSGPRGNLRRPETAWTSLYGNNLDDWCLHFDEVLP